MDKSHTHHIRFSKDLRAQKLTKLEEVARFDSVLDRIQCLIPYDMCVYDHIVQTREAMFRLQQSMRGCEIIEFAAPWIEHAELFWVKKKQLEYNSEADEATECDL